MTSNTEGGQGTQPPKVEISRCEDGSKRLASGEEGTGTKECRQSAEPEKTRAQPAPWSLQKETDPVDLLALAHKSHRGLLIKNLKGINLRFQPPCLG